MPLKKGWNRLVSFEEKIERIPFSGCWIWMAGLARNGYGQTSENHKTKFAHRMAWKLYRGEIPDGLFVLHKCDIKCCVNPDHLYLGTQKDNIRDVLERMPHVFTGMPRRKVCKYGHELRYMPNQGRQVCPTCQREKCRIKYWRRKEQMMAGAAP